LNFNNNMCSSHMARLLPGTAVTGHTKLNYAKALESISLKFRGKSDDEEFLFCIVNGGAD